MNKITKEHRNVHTNYIYNKNKFQWNFNFCEVKIYKQKVSNNGLKILTNESEILSKRQNCMFGCRKHL